MINKLFKRLVAEQRGFTLVEMLIAVLLLTVAVSGPLTIASRGITISVTAKDQVTAFFLAQDAIEYIRFVRDSNALTEQPWLTGLNNCTGSNGCYLDSTGNNPSSPNSCTSGGCPIMQYSTNVNRYGYSMSGGVTSPIQLRRTVQITTPVNGNAGEAAVTVRVSWMPAPGQTREVVVRENIFDWQF